MHCTHANPRTGRLPAPDRRAAARAAELDRLAAHLCEVYEDMGLTHGDAVTTVYGGAEVAQ